MHELRVVAIDPSLRSTGYYRSDTGETGVIKCASKISQYDAIYKVSVGIRDVISDCGPELILLESLASYMSARTTVALAMVRGAIVCAARAFNLPVVDVPVATWKSRAIGRMKKATADEKRAYLHRACALYDRVFDTLDEADAYMIYRAVSEIMAHEPTHKVAMQIKAATMQGVVCGYD